MCLLARHLAENGGSKYRGCRLRLAVCPLSTRFLPVTAGRPQLRMKHFRAGRLLRIDSLHMDAAAQSNAMTSPILRLMGAIAGLGSATLWWFFGSRLAPALRNGILFSLPGPEYALFAFLVVPALILAVVALFWVPPRLMGGGPLPEGRRWRLALVLLFAVGFVLGLAR